MIFIKNFTPSNFQNFKLISESLLSTLLSQNGIWKDGMIDLESGRARTTIDSRKWLKSSKSSGFKICSGSGFKSKSWNTSSHSFSHNGMWHSKIGDSSSRWQVWESKLTLKYCSNQVAKQESILIQKFELDHKFETQGHIPHWVQFCKNERLPFCQ